ncbi:MAG TPA: NlpC/P60 family protein [Candidatus Paceibacterota bacterium]
MRYRSVGNRCAIHLPSLELPISEEKVLAFLKQVGFSIVDVNLAEMAQEYIGKAKYQLGAPLQKAPHVVDCSSFTKWIFGRKGIWLSRLSIQQREMGVAVESPIGGDLVFTVGYRNFYKTDPADEVGHVGVTTDDNHVIHAAGKKTGVTKTSLQRFMCGRYRGIRRIVYPNTITLVCPTAYAIETSDDIRWLVLRKI